MWKKIIKKILILITIHAIVIALYNFNENIFNNYVKIILLEFPTLQNAITTTKNITKIML